jgi:MFS family permease
MALALGPLLGGLITEHISWNWIFYVNVPVGALGLVAALRVAIEGEDGLHDMPDFIQTLVALLRPPSPAENEQEGSAP